MLPEEIKNFIEVFSRLPSIGPRQATRLAFKIISKGKSEIETMKKAVNDLTRIKICPNCFFPHSNDSNLCNICSLPSREKDIFMIVEKETDLISIERTKKYSGRYLIIGELTKSGVLESWQKLRINLLKKIIEDELPGKKAKEIIIALNPNTYGDLNSSLIEKELVKYSNKISRMGRGIPTGGEIEFADEDTLSHSLQRRE